MYALCNLKYGHVIDSEVYVLFSLVPRPHPSRRKQFSEPSQISWAYYRNAVTTNGIAILLIIT